MDAVRARTDKNAEELYRLYIASEAFEDFVDKASALAGKEPDAEHEADFENFWDAQGSAQIHWDDIDRLARESLTKIAAVNRNIGTRCEVHGRKLGMSFEEEMISVITPDEFEKFEAFCIDSNLCSNSKRTSMLLVIASALPFSDEEMLRDAKGILEKVLAKDMGYPRSLRKAVVEHVVSKANENAREIENLSGVCGELAAFVGRATPGVVCGSKADRTGLGWEWG